MVVSESTVRPAKLEKESKAKGGALASATSRRSMAAEDGGGEEGELGRQALAGKGKILAISVESSFCWNGNELEPWGEIESLVMETCVPTKCKQSVS